MNRISRDFRPWTLVIVTALLATPCRAASDSSAEKYLEAARRFADVVVERGRDVYGEQAGPLFVDGLHATTLAPATWKKGGETWVLSNFASQQPLLRLLDGLTAMTGEPEYRRAAEEAARCALEKLRTPNGMLYWGGHLAWDLDRDKPVGQGTLVHELKNHQPHYRLMWRVDPAATRRLLETIWATHVVDWTLLDYNRHANAGKEARPRWDHGFDEGVDVPFPTRGSNLSFANVTPPLMHAGAMLAVLGDDGGALLWTRRLARRWQQARHPATGLSGGQLSYREQDRAQEALGHIHPQINEAMIVATYHQSSRYHTLPLAQMQAAESLLESGGERGPVGRELLDWASDDLKTYARRCYDPAAGEFPARMTDGTLIRWKESTTGYYVPESFAPLAPDGFLLWGYCLAYRLTRDDEHWQTARTLAERLGLGDLGDPEGAGRDLNLRTSADDWRLIYALIELDAACQRTGLLDLAAGVADNALALQSDTGLFPRPGREYARTGDEIPLALLHLAAAIEGKRELLPRAAFDRRFFHCEHDEPLQPHQRKRADARTYDHYVHYGQ